MVSVAKFGPEANFKIFLFGPRVAAYRSGVDN